MSTPLAPHFKISVNLYPKSNEEWIYMMKITLQVSLEA